MTISDLILRLTTLQKQTGPVAQIKIGKEFNNKDSFFDYFQIDATGNDVVLVPSDAWDKKDQKKQLQLNSSFGELK
jgi:hypothetical protein